MSNNDAELSIGVTDNATKNLDRIAASVRAMGKEMGASGAEIEKAVARATAATNKLATSTDLVKSQRANRNALIGMRQDLQKYTEIVNQSVRAQQALSRGDGRDARGRIVSNADIQQYLTALKAVENLERRIAEERRRLNTQGGMSPASPVGGGVNNPAVAASLAAQTAQTTALTAANRALAVSLVEVQQAKMLAGVWPPQMFRGAAQFTDAIMDMSNGTRYAMYDVSRNLSIAGLAMVALGVGAVVAAARWERSFADVQRTVQGTDETLARVRDGLIGLSQDLPVAFTELTKIASVGGQMGISAQGIIQYTETIAKLTATTNLTADAAGKALGRFKAFFAEADDPSLAVTDRTFSNLASSILKVGVNSVATESGIVNVATQISSMGSYAGFTADQVIGLSGALSSVGVPPELSRGVVTRLFNTIGEAVAQNGTKLQDFAKLAGVSSQTFASAWGTDRFAYIFTNMVRGLNSVNESSNGAVTALHDLGITSVRDVPVLLRLASAAGEAGTAGSLLAQTMNDARTGWRENIELTLQYSKISETLSARSQVLLQNLEALFATMGSQSVGPVKDLVNGLIGLVKGFTELGKTASGQIIGSWAIQIGIVGGAVLLLVAGLSRVGAAAIGAGTALQAMGVSAAVATPLVRGLSLALGALSVIGLVLTAAATIYAIANAAEAAVNPVQDLEGALAAMQADTASGNNPFAEFEAGADAAAMSSQDAGTQASRMGDLMGYAKDEVYGAAAATTRLGSEAKIGALAFGTASRDFLKSQILMSEGFKRLTAASNGAWVDMLKDADFNMDTLIERYAKGGKESAKAYLEGITGESVNTSMWDDIANSWVWLDQNAAKAARSNGDLLGAVGAGIDTFEGVANSASVAGDAMMQFTNATQLTDSALEDFQVQNEDTINSMAEGYKQFVDTSSLISFTQQLNAANATIDDLDTEANESAEAAASFNQAWQDAYGGASFTLAEYMTVFSAAAAEQQTQTQNLQTLFGRGVPSDIIADIAAMGPQAAELAAAMVAATQPELDAFVAMYGATGFDSMVGLAAGQLAAEQIVRNAASHLSSAQLQQLSADLTAGTPLVTAMAKWQLDANGNPIEAPVNYTSDIGGYLWSMQRFLSNNPLTQVVVYRPDKSALSEGQIANQFGIGGSGGWASGGYTGAGGKYQPAGTVHKGEFVFTKEATSAIGTSTLYSMMRSAQGGTPSKGSALGYAGGGMVGANSNTQTVLAHLSIEDRSLLMLIADRVGLTITEQTVAGTANAGNANLANRRVA